MIPIQRVFPVGHCWCIHAEIKYDGYIRKEQQEIEKMLIRYRPKTIAQAQLIPGMTPAAISILIFQTRKKKKVNRHELERD